MSFSIIAAIAKNNIIGKDNRLPWNIPEDLDNFYKLVKGKKAIMGHKTYKSLSGPIKNSENIVLSHDRALQLPGSTVMHSIDEVLALYQNSSEEIMIIGGASIYEKFLPFTNKMYLTLIENDISGDTYFPEWFKEDWVVTEERKSKSQDYVYSFVVLQRKLFRIAAAS